MFNNVFSENPAFYEIILKNVVECGRPQMAIWCMRIACWIPKDTDTFPEYKTVIDFPLPQWLQARALMLRYTYVACPVDSSPTTNIADRDSSVGIETRYGLEVWGSSPGGEEIFSTLPDRPRVHPASCTMGIESLSQG